MTDKKRVALYDNCKFLLIALVVFGHFIEQNTDDSHLFKGLFIFIYSFHMPLFFFLSGLFDSAKTAFSKRLNRAAYYFSLYIVLKVVTSLVLWLVKGQLSFLLFTESGVPWFCFTLAVYTIIAGSIRKAGLNPVFVLILSVLAACFAGFDKSIGDHLCLSRTIVFLPFYIAGMCASREKLERIIQKRWLRIAAAVILVAVCVIFVVYVDKLYFLRKFFTGRNPFADSLRTFGPLIRLCCYLISAVLGVCFMAVTPKRSLGILTTYGGRTMQVYFWHRPVLYLLTYFEVNTALMTMGVVGMVIWSSMAVILTLLLSLKLFSFPTETIRKKASRVSS